MSKFTISITNVFGGSTTHSGVARTVLVFILENKYSFVQASRIFSEFLSIQSSCIEKLEHILESLKKNELPNKPSKKGKKQQRVPTSDSDSDTMEGPCSFKAVAEKNKKRKSQEDKKSQSSNEKTKKDTSSNKKTSKSNKSETNHNIQNITNDKIKQKKAELLRLLRWMLRWLLVLLRLLRWLLRCLLR